MPLARAPDIAAYHADPRGRYVAGERFVHLCENATTFATLLWGHPDAGDAAAFVDAVQVEMLPHVAAHVSFADARHLEGVDASAFARLSAYFAGAVPRATTRITAQAVVFGGGLAGSAAAGFFAPLQPPFPLRIFSDATAAAEWLGLSSDVLQSWDALRRETMAATSVVERLRRSCERALSSATLASCAGDQGIAPRTLQRQLAQRGTTFHRERDRVRLARAQQMLATRPEEKLHVVAHELGFATHQHFTDWFRRQTGISPSAARRR